MTSLDVWLEGNHGVEDGCVPAADDDDGGDGGDAESTRACEGAAAQQLNSLQQMDGRRSDSRDCVADLDTIAGRRRRCVYVGGRAGCNWRGVGAVDRRGEVS